jgi:hypothetical protein
MPPRTPHYKKVHKALERHPENEMHPKEIRKRTGLKAKQVSRAINRLKRDGKVRVVNSPDLAAHGNVILTGSGNGRRRGDETGRNSRFGRIYQGRHGAYRH